MDACRRSSRFKRCYKQFCNWINAKSTVPGQNALVSSSACATSNRRGLYYKDDIFEFTRGRFVRNEAEEMRSRYVRFNVHELARVAAEAVGSRSCVRIEKCPDGLYNKALLLTMEDGKQVIAKIPNPNAGAPHFTIASEVATMDFVRNVLNTPAPRVYAWSSRAKENPVGAEYIIMEKIFGIQLDHKWPTMEIESRLAIVKSTVSYQKAWMAHPFNQSGSLYYIQDLDGQGVDSSSFNFQHDFKQPDSKFAVGPTTAREFFDNGRGDINLDRGPWNTVEEYCLSIGHREKYCVQNAPHLPKSPITLCGPGTYQPTRERKLQAIDCYLEILKYLLPTDKSISSSFLWHGDLHLENIFVDPQNPTKIVGIIDWQSTELAPLFVHARQPYFLDHNGPPTLGLERPRLPENMEQLDQVSQREAKSVYLNRSLEALYNKLVHVQIPDLYRAMEFQRTLSFDLLLLARNLFVDGEATYLAQIVELQKSWGELPGVQAAGEVTFPLSFSDDELSKIEKDVSAAHRGIEAMKAIQESLGDLFPENGIVRAEQYADAKEALRQLKPQVIDEFARDEQERRIWEEQWPFDD